MMTTRYPKKLDEVHVRPERVDMKIEVALANIEQIRELLV
jgi:hypothetical protein